MGRDRHVGRDGGLCGFLDLAARGGAATMPVPCGATT
jgi:hypothetical protein